MQVTQKCRQIYLHTNGSSHVGGLTQGVVCAEAMSSLEMILTGGFACRGVIITQKLKKQLKDDGKPKLKDFKAFLADHVPEDIAALKSDVEEFAKTFPTIGFEKATMRYKD